MLLTSYWAFDLIAFCAAAVYLLYKYTSRKYKYWQERGVFCNKPLPFVGNFSDVILLRKTIADWIKDEYDSTDRDLLGVYIFDVPSVIVRSPKLVKNILVKDFSHFIDRNTAAPKHCPVSMPIVLMIKIPSLHAMERDVSILHSETHFLNLFTCLNPTGVVLDALKSRKEYNVRHDLVDIMKQLMNNKELKEDGSGEAVVSGLAIQYILAGFETTSTTISFTLYEFAMQPNIQNKARKELRELLEKHGEITYDNIHDMHYLNCCVKETLRMYPVLPFLERRCNKDYKVPDSNDVIENGTPVLIPVYGLHMDEQHFPEPFKYNPDRHKTKMDNSEGTYYVPFGEGPRNCLGARFGKIVTKLALVTILKDFEVLPCERTPKQIVFEPKSFLLQSNVGLPVKFKMLNSE